MEHFTIGDRVKYKTDNDQIVPIEVIQFVTDKIGIIKKGFVQNGVCIYLVDFEGEVIKLPDFAIKKVAPEQIEKAEISREDFHDLIVKFTSLKYLKEIMSEDPGTFGDDINEDMILEFADVSSIILEWVEKDLFGENI